ncbi:hypothetical protein [Thalassovita taeanensis]|nr:hypothetical protein [Thalassovita taeanensis]
MSALDPVFDTGQVRGFVGQDGVFDDILKFSVRKIVHHVGEYS